MPPCPCPMRWSVVVLHSGWTITKGGSRRDYVEVGSPGGSNSWKSGIVAVQCLYTARRYPRVANSDCLFMFLLVERSSLLAVCRFV